MQQHEEIEQAAVFTWARHTEEDYPALRWLYHTPNGGKRSKGVGARLKVAGVKPGVPDLCFPVPLHGFHGLYIELKHGKNKPSEDQREWLEYLETAGYCALVCYDREEAIRAILGYLDGTLDALPGRGEVYGR